MVLHVEALVQVVHSDLVQTLSFPDSKLDPSRALADSPHVVDVNGRFDNVLHSSDSLQLLLVDVLRQLAQV